MTEDGRGTPKQLEQVPTGSHDHVARIAGAKSVHPHVWKPMAPGVGPSVASSTADSATIFAVCDRPCAAGAGCRGDGKR